MKWLWILLAFALSGGMLLLGVRSSEPIVGDIPAPEPVASNTSESLRAQASRPDRAYASPDDGFLYGRVTTTDGTVYEGRLRMGGDEEAFWSDWFNGAKAHNPWVDHLPAEQLTELHPIEIFGVRVARRERPIELGRPFMVRFGDIVRIEAYGRDLRVTLKSGSVFPLDRFDADDFADGVRVEDDDAGVVDLGERQLRSIDFLPASPSQPLPQRLHGTVRTRQGDFTGFLQWDGRHGVASDVLTGRSIDADLALAFSEILSIERQHDGSRVTLLDGRELVLRGTRDVGDGHRGISVDDPRYGRVLISWEVFERVEFDVGGGGSGPGYDDFPPGRPLIGTVTTRAGARLAGRLVWDLDESETTETLDAPDGGVSYTLPFGRIAAVELPGPDADDGRLRVILHGGEELRLEGAGDLDPQNTGLLVFGDDRERPEWVSWADVERVELERASAKAPPADRPAP